jgi:hypothetical protein
MGVRGTDIVPKNKIKTGLKSISILRQEYLRPGSFRHAAEAGDGQRGND